MSPNHKFQTGVKSNKFIPLAALDYKPSSNTDCKQLYVYSLFILGL